MDDEEDPEAYAQFDDLALGVMQVIWPAALAQLTPGVQRNHAVLEEERAEAMEKHTSMPPVHFRFDVHSPRNPTIREQHGSVCQLDMCDALQRAWRRQTGEDELPSTNCYIASIGLEDATNGFPCDVFLDCRQKERIGGTFARGKLSGDSATHDAGHHLWVIHAGDKFAYPDDGRTIYSAQDFVEGGDAHLRGQSSCLCGVQARRFVPIPRCSKVHSRGVFLRLDAVLCSQATSKTTRRR